MPSGLIIKVGNFGFDLIFTVLNADGTPRDLTSLYVTLYVYTQEQQPNLLFSGNCTVSLLPTTGVCTYTVASGNFPTIGTFNGELEMTDTAPPTPPIVILEDTETFSINVVPSHP